MNEYPLENQVCTVEQAKELAKLLDKNAPESWWYWKYGNYGKDDEWKVVDYNTYPFSVKGKHFSMGETYRAYTGDELGVLLLSSISGSKLQIYKNQKGTHRNRVEFYCEYGEKCSEIKQTEAHAKADLAIKGLKEGWIKPKEFKYD